MPLQVHCTCDISFYVPDQVRLHVWISDVVGVGGPLEVHHWVTRAGPLYMWGVAIFYLTKFIWCA